MNEKRMQKNDKATLLREISAELLLLQLWEAFLNKFYCVLLIKR